MEWFITVVVETGVGLIYDDYIVDVHPAEWLAARRDKLNESMYIVCAVPYEGDALTRYVEWKPHLVGDEDD